MDQKQGLIFLLVLLVIAFFLCLGLPALGVYDWDVASDFGDIIMETMGSF